MQRIFWNQAQNRFRAGWRILLFILLFLTFSLLSARFLLANQLDQSEMLSIRAILLVIFTLMLLLIFARLIDKRSFVDYGLRIQHWGWWLDLGFGLVLGFVLIAGIFLFQLAAGWITITGTFVAPAGQSFWLVIWIPLILMICVGIYEELLARGYVLVNSAEGFRSLGKRNAVLMAWMFSSVLFGLLHLMNPNATVLSILNLVIAGFMLGLPVILGEGLAIPIGLHIMWNFAQGSIFGFPVSGIQTELASFIQIRSNDTPALWTGGAFGPEGGIISTITMLIGMGIIIVWIRWRRGNIQLDTSLAAFEATTSAQ